MLKRRSRSKKRLIVSVLAICMLGSLGGWQRGEDELGAALAPALTSTGSAARLYFAGQCSTIRDAFDNVGPWLSFPRLTLAPSPAGATSLEAVQAILRNEPDAVVTKDRSGIIRITLGAVPTALLNTRIARLTFGPEARWNSYPAIWAIRDASEVQAAMHRLNLRLPQGFVDILLTTPREDFPHLPPSLENVTMDQALDAVSQTFRDLVIYGICTKPNGQSFLWLDYTPLTECNSHFQVYSCFDPPRSKHLPGPIELSPDPSLSPNPGSSGERFQPVIRSRAGRQST